jgi:hypothetical protein
LRVGAVAVIGPHSLGSARLHDHVGNIVSNS